MLKEEAQKYPPYILVLTTKKGEQYAIDPDKSRAIVEAFNDSKISIIWLSEYEVGIDRFDFYSLEKRKVWDEEAKLLKALQKRRDYLSENKVSSLSFNQFLWVNWPKASLS